MGPGGAMWLALCEGQPGVGRGGMASWSRDHPLATQVRGDLPGEGDSQVKPGRTRGTGLGRGEGASGMCRNPEAGGHGGDSQGECLWVWRCLEPSEGSGV